MATTVNKRKDLLEMGWEEVPHPTLGQSLTYDLGRDRLLIFSSLDTPNEMLSIAERNENDPRKLDELIILRNYDFEGHTYIYQIQQLIEIIKN